MPLTSTDVRELAELERRATDLILEKRHSHPRSRASALDAAATCDLRAAAFLAIAEDMDRHGFDITAEKA